MKIVAQVGGGLNLDMSILVSVSLQVQASTSRRHSLQPSSPRPSPCILEPLMRALTPPRRQRETARRKRKNRIGYSSDWTLDCRLRSAFSNFLACWLLTLTSAQRQTGNESYTRCRMDGPAKSQHGGPAARRMPQPRTSIPFSPSNASRPRWSG